MLKITVYMLVSISINDTEIKTVVFESKQLVCWHRPMPFHFRLFNLFYICKILNRISLLIDKSLLDICQCVGFLTFYLSFWLNHGILLLFLLLLRNHLWRPQTERQLWLGTPWWLAFVATIIILNELIHETHPIWWARLPAAVLAILA